MRGLLVAVLLALAAPLAAPAQAFEIALTFDDLPAHGDLPPGVTRLEVARATLAALDAAEAPAHGFVNGAFLAANPGSQAVLDLWRASGRPLGNHTWSHASLDGESPEAFAADVVRNEALLGGQARWLRFPYLAEGDTPAKRAAARAFLAGRGYRIASVTLSFDDYAWNDPYARCAARGDAAAVADLERRYLAAARASLDHARGLSQALHGRDIPYVLLMHLGAFDARMLPRLLALYRAAGARFVSLEAAARDPFYVADFTAAPAPAPVTLEAALRARGREAPARSWTIAGLDTVCR